jgi:hypothetical protein
MCPPPTTWPGSTGAVGAGRDRHPGATSGGDRPDASVIGALLHSSRNSSTAEVAQHRGRLRLVRDQARQLSERLVDAGCDPCRDLRQLAHRLRPSEAIWPGSRSLAAAMGTVINQGGARPTGWSPGWRRTARDGRGHAGARRFPADNMLVTGPARGGRGRALGDVHAGDPLADLGLTPMYWADPRCRLAGDHRRGCGASMPLPDPGSGG